jgi:hypothetical protein
MIITGKKAIKSGITPIAPENRPLIFPWVTAIPQNQCDITSIQPSRWQIIDKMIVNYSG